MTPWRSQKRWKSRELVSFCKRSGAPGSSWWKGKGFQLVSGNGPKLYPVGIVGESNYQGSIRRCMAGQRVEIVHEPDNPYDSNALAVVTESGETIGYIARDCWLQDAIHEEGHGCEATIKEIMTAEIGQLGVVLDVSVGGGPVPRRPFGRAVPRGDSSASATREQSRGWLARLFKL